MIAITNAAAADLARELHAEARELAEVHSDYAGSARVREAAEALEFALKNRHGHDVALTEDLADYAREYGYVL